MAIRTEATPSRLARAKLAATAQHGFYALDLIADGLVKYGVGQEDQPVRAGVGLVYC